MKYEAKWTYLQRVEGIEGEVLGISYIQKNDMNEGMVWQRRLAIAWIHRGSSSHFVVGTLMAGVLTAERVWS